ncbi:Myb-like, SWIRM and MPN domains 1 [Quaeritorhiza haematococci]|nr:Myb-like, SWIRM and MPN domains 1 [Quaeritorhiza haematococci]
MVPLSQLKKPIYRAIFRSSLEQFDDSKDNRLPVSSVVEPSLAPQIQAISDDSGMDPASKALIESMLAEEAFYYGQHSLTGLPTKQQQNKTSKSTKSARDSSSAGSASSSGGKKRKRGGDRSEKDVPDSGASDHGGKPKKKGRSDSPTTLPSHKTKWTPDENQTLVAGIQKFGMGNWKDISSFLGTRTALQVKNHVRHMISAKDPLLASFVAPGAKTESVKEPKAETEGKVDRTKEEKQMERDLATTNNVRVVPSSSAVQIGRKNTEEEEEDIEIDITDGEDEAVTALPPVVPLSTDTDSSDSVSETQQKTLEEAQEGGAVVASQPSTSLNVNTAEDHSPDDRETRSDIGIIEEGREGDGDAEGDEDEEEENEEESMADSDGGHENEDNAVVHADSSSRATTASSATAAGEKEIDPATIQTFEILSCPEFFANHPVLVAAASSSPSSSSAKSASGNKNMAAAAFKRLHHNAAYKSPSAYITIRNKILGRWEEVKPAYVTKTSVRKGLKGDVHAISRVHEFLERIGAINTCGRKAGVAKGKPRGRSGAESSTGGGESRRKSPTRYITPPSGFTQPDEVLPERRLRRVRNEDGEWVYEHELEGRVIDHDAERAKEREKELAALARKERRQAAGNKKKNAELLDSYYDPFRLIPLRRYRNAAEAPFHVNVKASAMCEMDPESEMRAREVFAAKSLEVVGWYHSHPTFIPDPSIRDIENQAAYQTLFKRDDGSEPFIGMIVTPYPAGFTAEAALDDKTSKEQTLGSTIDEGAVAAAKSSSSSSGPSYHHHHHHHHHHQHHQHHPPPKPDIEELEHTLVSSTDADLPPEMKSTFSYVFIGSEWNAQNTYRIPYACQKTIVASFSSSGHDDGDKDGGEDPLSITVFEQIKALLDEYRSYEQLSIDEALRDLMALYMEHNPLQPVNESAIEEDAAALLTVAAGIPSSPLPASHENLSQPPSAAPQVKPIKKDIEPETKSETPTLRRYSRLQKLMASLEADISGFIPEGALRVFLQNVERVVRSKYKAKS